MVVLLLIYLFLLIFVIKGDKSLLFSRIIAILLLSSLWAVLLPATNIYSKNLFIIVAILPGLFIGVLITNIFFFKIANLGFLYLLIPYFYL